MAIPVLNEEDNLADCLATVDAQTYRHILEVLIIDGGSTDRTSTIAAARPGTTRLDNPHRIQACALNMAIRFTAADIIIRVDAHCRLDPDYVERCVEALERTGAAMVGGALRPVGTGVVQRGIAAAMSSRLGAGPARFHTGGSPGWVDTVYLGAYRVRTARAAGGYSEVPINEDAEFAHRMAPLGGIWFDPAIRSTYIPRADLPGLARQFFRYGTGRARTVRTHPNSLSPRQLAAPLLLAGFASPWRRAVLTAYTAVIGGWAVRLDAGRREAAVAAVAMPTMHVSWALGFFAGLAGIPFGRRSRRCSSSPTS